MTIQRFVLTCVLVCAFAFTALAADATWVWKAQIPGRGGNTAETTFNLKVDGDKLTGSMVGPQGRETPIADGKVSGDDISFSVALKMQDNEVKFLFKGKVSGSEIKFTRQREGADRTQEFTAKKAS